MAVGRVGRNTRRAGPICLGHGVCRRRGGRRSRLLHQQACVSTPARNVPSRPVECEARPRLRSRARGAPDSACARPSLRPRCRRSARSRPRRAPSRVARRARVWLRAAEAVISIAWQRISSARLRGASAAGLSASVALVRAGADRPHAGPVAQRSEQRTHNPSRGGSNPPRAIPRRPEHPSKATSYSAIRGSARGGPRSARRGPLRSPMPGSGFGATVLSRSRSRSCRPGSPCHWW